MTVPEDTPAKLRGLMAFRRMSCRRLASAVGWRSHNSVNRLITRHERERATTIPEARALRVARVLGVDVHELFVCPGVIGSTDQNDRPKRVERAA